MPNSAQDSRVAVALLNLSGFATGFSQDSTQEALEVTTLVDKAKVFIPGQNTGSVLIDMILDTTGTANGQFDGLHDLKGVVAASPYTLGPEGFTTGDTVVMHAAHETQITTSSQVADVVRCSITAQVTDRTDIGVVLEDFAAITTTTTGTARDNGAATSNGGVAHLHVTAYATLTSNTVTVEHSVDGVSSWATLASFTVYSAVTSQRVEVAAGTTVRRYLRVVDTVVGSGSTTRFVSFARR
jgi:hypothetical protein